MKNTVIRILFLSSMVVSVCARTNADSTPQAMLKKPLTADAQPTADETHKKALAAAAVAASKHSEQQLGEAKKEKHKQSPLAPAQPAAQSVVTNTTSTQETSQQKQDLAAKQAEEVVESEEEIAHPETFLLQELTVPTRHLTITFTNTYDKKVVTFSEELLLKDLAPDNTYQQVTQEIRGYGLLSNFFPKDKRNVYKAKQAFPQSFLQYCLGTGIALPEIITSTTQSARTGAFSHHTHIAWVTSQEYKLSQRSRKDGKISLIARGKAFTLEIVVSNDDNPLTITTKETKSITLTPAAPTQTAPQEAHCDKH